MPYAKFGDFLKIYKIFDLNNIKNVKSQRYINFFVRK